MVRICLYVYVCVAPPMTVGTSSMTMVLYGNFLSYYGSKGQ